MFLFVGERPSPTAASRGWAWGDGRLAAKQLFDALGACGIDPLEHRFDNLFDPDPHGPEVVCPKALRRVRYHASAGKTVVAMGRKVSGVLAAKRVRNLSIVHPAARGAIRAKEKYAEHVRSILLWDTSTLT